MPQQSIRVGVPPEFQDALRHYFPDDVDIIRVPADLHAPLEVDFWIPPYMSKTVADVAPFMRDVKVVQALSAGIDAMAASIPVGTILCDGQGIHDIPVAEWTVAVILASLKYLPFYQDAQHSEAWKRRFEAPGEYARLHPGTPEVYPPIFGEDLCAKQILIVGYGAIGKAIERRLEPFDVTFQRIGRRQREGVSPIEDLDNLLPSADIVILIVPLTPDTRNMFDTVRLAKMKQGALLVNAARGPVVDTNALVTALQANRIRAALDVVDPEPLPAGHPLWKAPNLLITPHVGGGSPLFLERAFKLAGEQVNRYVQGEPLLNVVTEGY